MNNDLIVNEYITIPEHELDISAARSGGPGGQHVNKTSTKIVVRWNIKNSHAIPEDLKQKLITKLSKHITHEGDIIVQNSSTRSQQQNKHLALMRLAQEIRDALYVPKKRIPVGVPKRVKEERKKSKTYRSHIKKFRSKKSFED